MTASLPKLRSVTVRQPSTIEFTLRDGARGSAVLAGLIDRYAGLQPLRAGSLFSAAKVVDWGAAVGWPGDIAISAATLVRLAQEQRAFTAEDFNAWQSRLELSNREAADALGVSLSTIKNMKNGAAVSSAVAIACRAMESEPLVLAAHFRPRKPGRPSASLAGFKEEKPVRFGGSAKRSGGRGKTSEGAPSAKKPGSKPRA